MLHVVVLMIAGLALQGCRRGSPEAYVGSARCRDCHAAEYRKWERSAHALAMREARPDGVAASFDGAAVDAASLQMRPLSDGQRLRFEAPAAAGASAKTLPLAYVLGTAQIEQFLTPARGGRLQALPIGYDTVAHQWFDLFPEAPTTRDWPHWTNPGMTANSECIACHVTGYVRGYEATGGHFRSRWSELGVGCEACHGPGSGHAADPTAYRRGRAPRYGAVVSRGDAAAACAPCHSRRIELREGFVPGRALDDYFAFELLDTDVYHPDGQVDDEAYEWTSFQLSVMAERGVVCQDCHEPHGGQLRAAGDTLCLQCHAPALATPAHTHHAEASAGARCVGCHMPEATFMERDRRRDHQLKRPDPEGARLLGVPDACTGCHTDRTQRWAAEWVRRWDGPSGVVQERRRIAGVIQAARAEDPRARDELLRLLATEGSPTRLASLARLLAPRGAEAGVVSALRSLLGHPQALVRAGAAAALGTPTGLAPTARTALARATADSARSVRLEAAFGLRSIALDDLDEDSRQAVEAASAEWLAAQTLLADRPEPNFNRGVFLEARGDRAGAEAAFRAAIARWEGFLPARHRLAVLLAASGRHDEAETELRAALTREPGWPLAAFALALLQGEQGRWQEAAALLEDVVVQEPTYPRAFYNLGLAYAGSGDLERAAAALERAVDDPASHRDALRELVRLAHTRGDRAGVERWLPAALRADETIQSDPRIRAWLAAREPRPSP